MDNTGSNAKITTKSNEQFYGTVSGQVLRRVMKDKMRTEGAKKIYDRRKETVEPAFGDIKENKGMLSFLTRNLIT